MPVGDRDIRLLIRSSRSISNCLKNLNSKQKHVCSSNPFQKKKINMDMQIHNKHCMCSYHTSLKSLFLFTMTFKKMSRKCFKSFQIDSVHALELTIKINIS